MTQAEIDLAMMRRCVGLSAAGPKHGDLPIAALVCDSDKVLAEAVNEVRRRGDVTRHAEIVALMAARGGRKRRSLAGCTLYSTVEPCPMCSFVLREMRVPRVVYALASPKMGGVSKWNVLRDRELSGVVPEIFGPVPEVVAGLLAREAAGMWQNWNPFVWTMLQRRGCFAPLGAAGAHMPGIPSWRAWRHALFKWITG